jgi:hypothetical protein
MASPFRPFDRQGGERNWTKRHLRREPIDFPRSRSFAEKLHKMRRAVTALATPHAGARQPLQSGDVLYGIYGDRLAKRVERDVLATADQRIVLRQ